MNLTHEHSLALKMAAKIINLLASKYEFNAEEALAYYKEHKDETGSTTSLSTVQRAENAIAKTTSAIDDLKSKMATKKGKSLENATAKLAKLEEKLEEQNRKLDEKKKKEVAKAEKAAKPKKEPKTPKEPKAPKADDDKRIKRMSPALTKQLTKIFEDSNKEFTKENGQKFAKYVNELEKEAFEAKNLADHMRDFVATINAPAPEPAKEPEEVVDEDLTEVTFKGIKYVVGEISKRVYIADEENGDQFVGFLGLGKFKGMKIEQ